MYNRHRTLDGCHSIADLRELASRRLPAPIFHYLEGGAEGETTVHRNTGAFDAEQLIPRCLVDVSYVNTTTRVLGQELQWPLICSPTGASRLYHAEGELAVARATAVAGTLYGLSVASTHSLEAVAAASNGAKMFQVLAFKDRELTRELIERCKRAQYAALCLTVDAAVRGKRERELRAGNGVVVRPSLSSLAGLVLRPRWFFGQARKGPLSMSHFSGRTPADTLLAHGRYLSEQLDPSVSWQEVRAMIDLWGGPFAIKGIMSVDDARRAADIGATAVIVSNHGGRQLDGAAAPIEVLPEIARAVGDRIEVILDGGIRRGVHVLKALALGAKACAIGRPYLYGLSAGGEQGVAKALGILKAELIGAMQLSGCSDVRNIDEQLVRRF
jgi:L-lactate dehydrogenase (cytochrome)